MSRVLIADDEEALLDVFATIVTDMGHEVLTAINGEEALRLALAHRPDLIVSDYMMPRRNGLEVLRSIRSVPELEKTPFILVSAAKPRDVGEASRYLPKPVSLEAFEEAVRDGLEAAPVAAPEQADRISPAQETALSLARDEMLNWVSHEIRTPLSAAKISLQLIQRHLQTQGDATQRRRIETVLHELDRMNDLVASVLEATRLSEGRITLEKQRGDFSRFLQQFVARWRDLRPDLQLDLELPAGAVVLDFDAARVTQVLDNFLSNALKYGGEASRVDMGLVAGPTTADVHVRDFGEGIEAAELPRLFERFHRAKGASGSGHGLGLYIASALARLHGGELRVESQRGCGSKFTLSLPLPPAAG